MNAHSKVNFAVHNSHVGIDYEKKENNPLDQKSIGKFHIVREKAFKRTLIMDHSSDAVMGDCRSFQLPYRSVGQFYGGLCRFSDKFQPVAFEQYQYIAICEARGLHKRERTIN